VKYKSTNILKNINRILEYGYIGIIDKIKPGKILKRIKIKKVKKWK